MKIGIVQVDGKFPNVALMKITAYHEKQGHEVEWYKGALFANEYDKVYASKIFDFSPMPQLPPSAIIGGTGIDFTNNLPAEIENTIPSYSLHKGCNYHVGFSMKGCRFSCSFCCVPIKEGKPYKYSDIDGLLINPNGGNRLMLMDNDFFGVGDWEQKLNRIRELKLKVNFNQGLNIRILTQRQANAIASVKYWNTHYTSRYLTFAWDRYQDSDDIMKGIERCDAAGIRRDHLQFFVLVGFDTTIEQDIERITTLAKLGCMPFVMKYGKLGFSTPIYYQTKLAHLVNRREIFNSKGFNLRVEIDKIMQKVTL